MPQSIVNGNEDRVFNTDTNNGLAVHSSDNVTSVINAASKDDTLDFLRNKKLSELTPDQLRQLEDAAKRERKEKSESALIEAWQFFIDAAKSADLELTDAVNFCEPSLNKNGKKSRPTKYRNPLDKQQTWGGLGRKPKWFSDNLSNGVKEEDMLV